MLFRSKPTKHQVKPSENKETLEKALNTVGIDISHIKEEKDRQIYVLKRCPFNDNHTDKAAYIVEFNNGNIAAGCHHDSCMGNDWSLLVEKYGIKYDKKISTISTINIKKIRNNHKKKY